MIDYFNLGNGINTYSNPMSGQDGQMIHGVNLVNFPAGALSKRPGYTTFLNSLGAQVNTLISYPQQNGSLFLYAAAGSTFNYSLQGTANWALVQGSTGGDSGGTITNNAHLGYAFGNNVLIVGDGQGSTRHTTVGSVFTNTSLAPKGQYFAQYQGRAYTTSGTDSVLAYSVANDFTNWNTGGTSDSSSLTIPDEAAAGPLFVAGDRLDIVKTRGKMFNWDGNSLVDMATKYGPTMPWSIANIDDYWFLPNQYGLFGFDGANRTLLSNPVQQQFYNRGNTGMGTGQIGANSSACGAAYLWDYFLTMGTVTDNFTGRTINNAILKYDYQKNTFLNWTFANTPTAMLSYTDVTNQKQFIFGDSTGQVYQLNQTATSDNGAPIPSEAIFMFSYASQQQQITNVAASIISGMSYEKKWNWIRLFFDPGDEVNIQYAFSNTFTYEHLKWSEAINSNNRTGDYFQSSDGVVEIRFPVTDNNPPRSRLLFLRIYDNADNSSYTLYGVSIDAEPQIIR